MPAGPGLQSRYCGGCVRRGAAQESTSPSTYPPARASLEPRHLVQDARPVTLPVAGAELDHAGGVVGGAVVNGEDLQPGPARRLTDGFDMLRPGARVPGHPQVIPAVQHIRRVARLHESLGRHGPCRVVQNWPAAHGEARTGTTGALVARRHGPSMADHPSRRRGVICQSCPTAVSRAFSAPQVHLRASSRP